MKPERLKWTPELVSRFWDGFSQTALVQFSFAKQAGPTLLAAMKHLLPREGELLDFGAGDGHLVRLLCGQGFKTAAYEPSEGRIGTLEASMAGVDNFLGVIDKDSKRSFDLAIMSEVIEHILDEELDSTLGRLAEFTRPGGMLIVTTPNNEDLDTGMAYCPVSNTLFHRWQHVRSFTEDSLAALLSRYGFEEIATHRLSFDAAVLLPWDLDTPPPRDSRGKLLEVPDYIVRLRQNQRAIIGSETNLMYLGRRRLV